MLTPGRHTLTISSFAVPDEPVVEPVTFELINQGLDLVVEKLESLFVADAPGVSETDSFTVAVGDGEQTLTVGEIIDVYAPILHFSSDERYTVPFDFEEVILATARPNGLYDGVRRGDAMDYLDTSSFLHGLPDGPIPDDIPPGFYHDSTATPGTIYATVTATDTQFHINYWFFYGVSNWGQHGDGNTHELDVEGIGIAFTKEQDAFSPSRVVYSQHDVVTGLLGVGAASEILSWDHVDRSDTQPHVYVGLGGHASYPFVGVSDVLTPDGFIKEAHDGDQLTFTPDDDQVHFVPNISTSDTPEWLLYPGYLGNPALEAPRGPVFLGRFQLGANGQPIGSTFGERYLDPLDAWVDPFSTFVPGNVTVVQKKSKITINGTNLPDHIDVHQTENDDWVITGLHGTTVNGASGSLTISDAPRRLKFDLGGGDDAVIIHDVALPQLLRIKTGDGDDFVRLTNVSSLGGTSISTGKGTDLVQLISSTFGAITEVITGQRDDEVHIKETAFGASAFFDAGEGHDILRREELIDAIFWDFEEVGCLFL